VDAAAVATVPGAGKEEEDNAEGAGWDGLLNYLAWWSRWRIEGGDRRRKQQIRAFIKMKKEGMEGRCLYGAKFVVIIIIIIIIKNNLLHSV